MKAAAGSRSLIVFGGGVIAEVALRELENMGFQNILFSVDKGFAVSPRLQHHRIIDWEDLENEAPPSTHAAFVAVGYQELNRFRESKVASLRSRGYSVASVGPRNAPGAENVMIARDALVQVGTVIGRNTFVWGGAVVGHHSRIGENCWISSGATIAGNCEVGDFSFIGVGAVVTHEVTIGPNCIIGAGALVTRDLPPESVVIPKPTPISPMNSGDFNRLFPL